MYHAEAHKSTGRHRQQALDKGQESSFIPQSWVHQPGNLHVSLLPASVLLDIFNSSITLLIQFTIKHTVLSCSCYKKHLEMIYTHIHSYTHNVFYNTHSLRSIIWCIIDRQPLLKWDRLNSSAAGGQHAGKESGRTKSTKLLQDLIYTLISRELVYIEKLIQAVPIPWPLICIFNWSVALLIRVRGRQRQQFDNACFSNT